MTDGTGRIFYGWYIVAACWVVNFVVFGISVNTFTVYVKPIQADLGWSRGEISLAISLSAVAMGLGAPFIGRLIDRIGREFLAASRSSLVLTPPTAFGGVPDDGGIQADYRPATGFAGGALQLDPLHSIRLVYAPGEIDDGLDNNGNGLVDECRIVILPDVGS